MPKSEFPVIFKLKFNVYFIIKQFW